MKLMKTSRKGFTLIELIVVIAVLSILAFLIVPQVTGYVSKSQSVVCENNRNTILREYEMKHAQDDSVTLKSVLDSHKTVCPDPKGVVTIGSDGESLICSIHGGGTAKQSSVIQTLQEFIDSYAGEKLVEKDINTDANNKNFTVTQDIINAAVSAAKNAGIENPVFPAAEKMHWDALVVKDTANTDQIAMVGRIKTKGISTYLLYYKERLYCYESKDVISEGNVSRSNIDNYLPDGINTSTLHGWILVQ
jgi:prepilin-type N-terminal cleavage/methylation domain-containing protein